MDGPSLKRTASVASTRSNASWFGGLPGGFRALKRELSDFVRTASGDDLEEASGGKRRRAKSSKDSAMAVEDPKRRKVLDPDDVFGGPLAAASVPELSRLDRLHAGTRSTSQPVNLSRTADDAAKLQGISQHRSRTPFSGLSSSSGPTPQSTRFDRRAIPGTFDFNGSAPPSRPISPRPRRTTALGGPSPRQRRGLGNSVSSIDSILADASVNVSGVATPAVPGNLAASIASNLNLRDTSLFRETLADRSVFLDVDTSRLNPRSADASLFYSLPASAAGSAGDSLVSRAPPEIPPFAFESSHRLVPRRSEGAMTFTTNAGDTSGFQTANNTFLPPQWGSLSSMTSKVSMSSLAHVHESESQTITVSRVDKGKARCLSPGLDDQERSVDPSVSMKGPISHPPVVDAKTLRLPESMRADSISKRVKASLRSLSSVVRRDDEVPAEAVEVFRTDEPDSNSDFEMMDAPVASRSQVNLAASTTWSGKRKRVASERHDSAVAEVTQANKRIKRLESELEKVKRELEEERATNEKNRRAWDRERSLRRKSSRVRFSPSPASSPRSARHQRQTSDPMGTPVVVRKPSAGALVGGSPFIVARPYGDGPDAVGEKTPRAKAPRITSRGGAFGVGLPGLAKDLFGAGLPSSSAASVSGPPVAPPPPPPPPPVIGKVNLHIGLGRPRAWEDPLKTWPDPAELQSQSRTGLNRSPSKELKSEGPSRKGSTIGVGFKGVDMGRFISELKTVKLRKTGSSNTLSKATEARSVSDTSTIRTNRKDERILHAALKQQFGRSLTTRPSELSLRSQATTPDTSMAPTPAKDHRHALSRTVHPGSAVRQPDVVMGNAVTTPRRVSAESMQLDMSTRRRVTADPQAFLPRSRSSTEILKSGFFDRPDTRYGQDRAAELEDLADALDSAMARPSIRLINGPPMHSPELYEQCATPRKQSHLAELSSMTDDGGLPARSSPVLSNITQGRPKTPARKVSSTRTKKSSKGSEGGQPPKARSRPASVLSMLTRRTSARTAANSMIENFPPEESVYEGRGTIESDPSNLVGYGVAPGAAEGTSGKEWVVVGGGRNLLGDGEKNDMRWGLRPGAIFAANPRLVR